jgi:hypothetical protein
MARTFGDLMPSNAREVQDNLIIAALELNIGATGAVGSQIFGPPGVTFTRTGAGTYTLVYPPALGLSLVPFVAVSAAGTVIDGTITAKNAPAGTATVVFRNAAGAATDPANGDIVGLLFFAKASAPVNA